MDAIEKAKEMRRKACPVKNANKFNGKFVRVGQKKDHKIGRLTYLSR